MEKKKLELREVHTYLITWMPMTIGNKASEIQRSIIPITSKLNSKENLAAFEKDFATSQKVEKVIIIAFSHMNTKTHAFIDGIQVKGETYGS
jgi:hypothetical protein